MTLMMAHCIRGTDLELLFGLDVLDGGEEDLRAVLVGHHVLLQVVLSRPHEHHPVTAVLVREVQPHVLDLLSVFLCIQHAQLEENIE